mgnify:CR=1 FL=1
MIETFGDVGQRPDEREGGSRIEATAISERHQHRRQRAEDEEQDHERAEAADQRLGQDARPPLSPPVEASSERRRARSGDASTPVGVAFFSCRAHLRRSCVDELEARRPGRVDRRERRVAVRRDSTRGCRSTSTSDVAGAGDYLRRAARSPSDARSLFVTSPSVRNTATSGGLLAGAEGLQRPLVRLVRRVAGDREASRTSAWRPGPRRRPRTASARPRPTITHQRRRATARARAGAKPRLVLGCLADVRHRAPLDRRRVFIECSAEEAETASGLAPLHHTHRVARGSRKPASTPCRLLGRLLLELDACEP